MLKPLCSFNNHYDSPYIMICSNKECQRNPVGCFDCFKTHHTEHVDDCINIVQAECCLHFCREHQSDLRQQVQQFKQDVMTYLNLLENQLNEYFNCSIYQKAFWDNADWNVFGRAIKLNQFEYDEATQITTVLRKSQGSIRRQINKVTNMIISTQQQNLQYRIQFEQENSGIIYEQKKKKRHKKRKQQNTMYSQQSDTSHSLQLEYQSDIHSNISDVSDSQQSQGIENMEDMEENYYNVKKQRTKVITRFKQKQWEVVTDVDYDNYYRVSQEPRRMFHKQDIKYKQAEQYDYMESLY